MSQLTDEQLLEELQIRIEEKNRLLSEQKQFMSDLKTVNDKLLQSEELKSHFLSNIKNEINNPMTSIIGLLRVNLATDTEMESRMRNTQLVYKEASALNFQLQNLFMAAELEAGEARMSKSKFTCVEVIGEAVSMVQSQLGDVKIACVVDADINESMVSDRGKLLVILSNLISNAHKFCDANNGQVNVDLTKNSDGQLVFSVSDNGVGISEEDLGDIYDRFNQLDAGTTKNYGGHGLGLSVVHALVDLLDGSLKIHSQPGKGTEVTVSLPAVLESQDEEIYEEDDFELFLDSDEQSF
ncbi:sensor histidine kinase [Reichenbachiella ulvae]|uniref:histidine kinase n=1 Tax=Reichenbachiella ulvae TaxID=2980104 RepID=A0ABT3CS47_9BACT|nr:HAMP domain-containing sensor histidine kinase [Reichenbachiella ulvae]MCV9386378.1 HAMP domain-containing histidine kinase [Reichenbachiella ulvae]